MSKSRPKLADAPAVPGFYRRALFGWLPIPREEYNARMHLQHEVLLQIEPSDGFRLEPCLICRNGPWLELCHMNGSMAFYAAYRPEVPGPKDPLWEALAERAAERRLTIVNDPRYGGKVVEI